MNSSLLTKDELDQFAQGFRILIVDDDVDIGAAMRDILEMEEDDYQVAVATSAVEAEQLASRFQPDLALLDIKLGPSNGLDLVPKLRRDIPGIICVMMTAFRDSEYAVTAVKFGADDYLLKPVEPERLLTTLRDMRIRKAVADERREAERRIRALNGELEQRVAERTEELQLARRKAEAASEAKTRFLSRMSHELRTPMNAILGFAQLLELEHSPPLSERQHEYVQEIVNAGGHLLDLINEVLDLTKIESGKFNIRLKALDFGEVLAESLALTGNLASERGINVFNQPTTGPIRVRADHVRLKQILVNLISNAIKYNVPDGRVDIEHEVDGSWLLVRVRDTGIGISTDHQQRIFHPFEVVDDDANSDGIGIGLSIVSQLMRLMGGELGLESEPGKGSLFWFKLALDGGDTRVRGRTSAVPQRRATVLCVEGDAFDRLLVANILKSRSDIELDQVNTAGQALQQLDHYRPDLILLDLSRQDLEPDVFLRLLKRAADGPGAIPVLGLGTGDQSESPLGPDTGLADCLSKPLNLEDLLDAVDRQLAGGSGARQG